ncbi:MAG: protein-L-isoaspartate(D-aspartate) O-methyltransferase [Acidobacteriota bacterium]|jgi:protein-L-isoaspartate(D-aspartate) O-methyltransferase
MFLQPAMSVSAGSLAEHRHAMVERQLRGRGIRAAGVLSAMGRVPRERFVLQQDAARAYDDCPLPIGHGATISQPYIVALMTEALELRRQDRVLEVGTGSGYQTAILAELSREVFTVEIVPELSAGAARRLREMGRTSVRFRIGDGRCGWPEEAPFDAVLVAAAPARLPPALLSQLAPGGRLVAPVGDLDQELTLWRECEGTFRTTHLTAVRFVPLRAGGPGEEETP